jgi:hypothetical protein
MLNENLWNQSKRLSPEMRKFSSDAHTFKKSMINFGNIEVQEREDIFRRSMRNLLHAKRDASERQNARRLERLIV